MITYFHTKEVVTCGNCRKKYFRIKDDGSTNFSASDECCPYCKTYSISVNYPAPISEQVKEARLPKSRCRLCHGSGWDSKGKPCFKCY